MEKQEAIKKLEETVGAYLLSGKADNTTCGEWREILETLKKDETCKDAVSRKTLLDYIENWKSLNRYYHPDTKNKTMPISEVIGIAKRLPSVTLKRGHGKWVAMESEEMETIGYYCSNCDLPLETEERTDFCPHCGARMEG